MNVHFTHPHRSDAFQADVAPECTGAAAVEGLVDAKFLEPPGQFGYDLTLARTKAPIGPNATLASCGVQEEDVINVLRRGTGASAIAMTKTETRTVRYLPPWAEDGERTVAVEVNERTTVCQLLKELGLKRHALLPMGRFPGLSGGTRVLEVELDPEEVALALADFVAVTAAEVRKIARLKRKLVAFFDGR